MFTLQLLRDTKGRHQNISGVIVIHISLVGEIALIFFEDTRKFFVNITVRHYFTSCIAFFRHITLGFVAGKSAEAATFFSSAAVACQSIIYYLDEQFI